MVWFDFLLILVQFCDGLSTVENGLQWWCWVGGRVVPLLFFYSSFAGLLCPLGCCVCSVFLLLGLENGERENMNGERNEGACAEQRDDRKWNEGIVQSLKT